MSGPFEFPPDPFDDELDRLLPPIPEPEPQPKPNGKSVSGVHFGPENDPAWEEHWGPYINFDRYLSHIIDRESFYSVIGQVGDWIREGIPYQGDVDKALLNAGTSIGLGKSEIVDALQDMRCRFGGAYDDEQVSTGSSQRRRNGYVNEPQPLKIIKASSFAGQPIPVRQHLDSFEFFVKDDASLLTGAGAIGKTLVILQLAASVAYPVDALPETNWLGSVVNVRGKVLFYSGEEDADELHRRLDDICAHEGFDLDRLGDLDICDMAAEEEKALLRPHDKHRDTLVKTSLFASLEKTVEAEKPVLLVIDNKAQIVKGNEMNRDVATDVINIFRALAKRHKCTVILLAHPSMSGIAQKTGHSGSTGWFNTTRGQVNMLRPDSAEDEDGPDDGRRILTKNKANYTQQGRSVNVIWELGCYRCTDQPPRAGSDIGKADKARRVFLKLLRLHNGQNINVSVSATSANYAPKKFYAHPENENVSIKSLATAMHELLADGAILNQQYGKPSLEMRRLWVA